MNLTPLFSGNLPYSGVFTNFDSFIPISYKHGLVYTFTF